MAVFTVTGGAGFIGSNIVRRLVADGHVVRVVDDLSTGRRENLDGLEGRIAVHEGSILDPALLAGACTGADCVIHQAALASVVGSVRDPVATNAVNVDGTLNVLVAARDAGVRRVVYASSSAVYGDTPPLPKDETMAPCPQSPYAVSKLAGEHYCRAFTHVYGLETVSLRYFNVYGPRQDPSSQYAAVIPIFIRRLLAGEPVTVYGDGEQSRDFVFVEDVAAANLAAAQAPDAAGAVVNIGSGERRTLNDLIAVLHDLTGEHTPPRYTAAQPGDVKHSQADISLARRIIGYEPQVDFAEGIRRTCEWYGSRRSG
ncbi:MAG: SDR family oxidoreductase [Candidatus Brocadiaceae bacterium]|mgnify:CR=1 FL=1|nr:SDR family oxidoreductase [Candidatus Brocadiaceae bacterium]